MARPARVRPAGRRADASHTSGPGQTQAGRVPRQPVAGKFLDPGGTGRDDWCVSVEAISIGPSHAIAPVRSVTAHAGKGLAGDRHYHSEGAPPGQALTLIEAEALEDVGSTTAPRPWTTSRRSKSA